MRTYWTRSGRYRGHSEGCTGLAARALGGLILLGWPWALGIGWAAWLIAVPVYALYAAAWYGTHLKENPMSTERVNLNITTDGREASAKLRAVHEELARLAELADELPESDDEQETAR